MNKQFRITLLPAGSIELSELTYVVIGAREMEHWIFVRHQERDSWELPAGHIEEHESADEAAKRELYEETGTVRSDLRALYDYSIEIGGQTFIGRIFFADVTQRGPLPVSEIAEIMISKTSPQPATYPEAHKRFIDILEKYVHQSNR
ncbi:MAG: NUDIX domain-containing protein [Bacteroidales bacterium]